MRVTVKKEGDWSPNLPWAESENVEVWHVVFWPDGELDGVSIGPVMVTRFDGVWRAYTPRAGWTEPARVRMERLAIEHVERYERGEGDDRVLRAVLSRER